jgi:hypothetical protein
MATYENASFEWGRPEPAPRVVDWSLSISLGIPDYRDNTMEALLDRLPAPELQRRDIPDHPDNTTEDHPDRLPVPEL